MIMTRASVITFWASGPAYTPPPEGCLPVNFFSTPCFPDLATLSPVEKDLLRPVIAAHPEYLLGALEFGKTIH
jgi:hypothetical protein